MGLSDEVDASLVFTPSPSQLPPRCALPLERGGENQPPWAAHGFIGPFEGLTKLNPRLCRGSFNFKSVQDVSKHTE